MKCPATEIGGSVLVFELQDKEEQRGGAPPDM